MIATTRSAMTPGATAGELRVAAGRLRHLCDHEAGGLRGVSLRRLAWTLLVVGLFSVWSATGHIIAADGWPRPSGVLQLLSSFVVQYGIWMVPAALAGTLADNLPLRGLARVLAIVGALQLGCTAGMLIERWLDKGCVTHCLDLGFLGVLEDAAVRALGDTALSSAVALALFTRRQDRETTAALQAAELSRADAERERLQATLAAMQARVEPSFLLDTLRDIGRRYVTDRATGGRLLDLLIAYLRAALPRDRGAGSTLERECALLRSWLGIAEIRSGGRLAGDCRLDPALRGVPLVPMLLLPLVAAAATVNGEAADGAIDVAAHAIDGRVRVAVRAVGPVARAMAASAALADISQRLRSIYGHRAAFVVDDRGDGTLQLIVEIPDERA